MKTFTISEAKAKLNALVQAAERGEEVLIMRGSKPVVTLTPVTEADLALRPAVPCESKHCVRFVTLELKTSSESGQFVPVHV